MGNERCRIIGLLGVPDSGKTACLVSLYLLLSHDRIPEYSFADSRSLVALDELSRGARRWQGGTPEQMTVHTERGDDRFPGFVHFKLRRRADGAGVNLTVPDLPGEWTNSLIDRNRTDRLSFLPSADAIWVMVNGRMLVDKEQRLGTIHRTSLIVDRIAELCDPDIPSLRLVVSRADLGKAGRREFATTAGKRRKAGHCTAGQPYIVILDVVRRSVRGRESPSSWPLRWRWATRVCGFLVGRDRAVRTVHGIHFEFVREGCRDDREHCPGGRTGHGEDELHRTAVAGASKW